MSHMNQGAFALDSIVELNFDEIDLIAGASEWGENVLKYGGGISLIGGFGGSVIPGVGTAAGAAGGFVVGAIVGTIVTIVDN